MSTAATLEREAIVRGLRALGVPLEKAEAEADRQLGRTVALPDPAEDDRARRLEKAEEQRVDAVYLAFGCRVIRLSQARASKQTPGIPDRYVFHRGVARAWWHEVKRPEGGVQSPAQKEFEDDCLACGVDYVLGGGREAFDQLVRLGITTEDQRPPNL